MRVIAIEGRQKNGPHGADPVVAEQRQTANLLASSAFAPFCGRVPKHGPRIHHSHCAGTRRHFFNRDARPRASPGARELAFRILEFNASGRRSLVGGRVKLVEVEAGWHASRRFGKWADCGRLDQKLRRRELIGIERGAAHPPGVGPHLRHPIVAKQQGKTIGACQNGSAAPRRHQTDPSQR